jgi:hypothetical protein
MLCTNMLTYRNLSTSTKKEVKMNKITFVQSLELIDLAAEEYRLYHYNGGQAYIRLDMNLNALMIIDHTNKDEVKFELMDGTQYFIDCAGYNVEITRYKEQGDTLVEWYNNSIKIAEMETV